MMNPTVTLLMREMVNHRMQSGMTQAQVARKMNVTQSAVSALERLRHEPQLTSLQRYAIAVGCKIEIRVERR